MTFGAPNTFFQVSNHNAARRSGLKSPACGLLMGAGCERCRQCRGKSAVDSEEFESLTPRSHTWPPDDDKTRRDRKPTMMCFGRRKQGCVMSWRCDAIGCGGAEHGDVRILSSFLGQVTPFGLLSRSIGMDFPRTFKERTSGNIARSTNVPREYHAACSIRQIKEIPLGGRLEDIDRGDRGRLLGGGAIKLGLCFLCLHGGRFAPFIFVFPLNDILSAGRGQCTSCTSRLFLLFSDCLCVNRTG
jgi:hypothetical protein